MKTPMALIPQPRLREMCGVSDMTIWRWRKQGILPAPLVLNRRNYYQQDVLETLIKRHAEVAGGGQ